jgi:xylose isomerase
MLGVMMGAGGEGEGGAPARDVARERAHSRHRRRFPHPSTTHPHTKKLGFKGTLLLEPKPQEPTKHQYDWDAATTAGFLRKYGLDQEFKLNIECNHATLSGGWVSCGVGGGGCGSVVVCGSGCVFLLCCLCLGFF